MADTELRIKVKVDGRNARSIGEIESTIRKVKKENAEAAKSAQMLREAYDLTEAEVKQVTAALKKANKEGGNFNSFLQGVGQGIGQSAFGVLESAISGSVETVRNLVASTLEIGQAAEQSRVAFTTLLGGAEAAEKTIADLTEFAATTPFEFPQVREAGQQLLAFQFDAEKLPETLERVGNVAAGVGTNFNELTEIYGKARVQGRLFAEDINQLTGRGIPVTAELAKQFGVTESEVRELVEAGMVGFDNLEQAFISLTSEGGIFFNLMEEQSKTIGGQLSNLSDRFIQVQQEAFDAFQPALAAGLQIFSDVLEEAGQRSEGLDIVADASERLQQSLEQNPEIAQQLGEALAFVADAGSQLLADALDGIAQWLSENPDQIASTTDNFKALVSLFVELAGIVGTVIKVLLELGGVYRAVLTPAIEFLTLITNRIGALLGGITGVSSRVRELAALIPGIDLNADTEDAVSNLNGAATAMSGVASELDRARAQASGFAAGTIGLTAATANATEETEAQTESVLEQMKAVKELAKAEAERLKQQREAAALQSERSFDDTQREEKREFDDDTNDLKVALDQEVNARKRALGEIVDAQQEASDELIEAKKDELEQRQEADRDALADEVDTLKDALAERIEARTETAEAEIEQAEQVLEAEKDALKESQAARKQALDERQRLEKEANDALLSDLEKQVDREVQLAEAGSRAERKALEEKFEAEDEAAEERQQIEARLLRREGIDADSLEDAERNFDQQQRDEQRALEDEFKAENGQIEAKELKLEGFITARKLILEEQNEADTEATDADIEGQQDALRQRQVEERQALEDEVKAIQEQTEAEIQALKLQGEQAIADFKEAEEMALEEMKRAFEDEQREEERSFQDEQRRLDRENAAQIRTILDNAENGIAPGQSLRVGGVAAGGLVQVHRDEFLVPPRGTRVVSQQESRALVRQALAARDVAGLMSPPAAGDYALSGLSRTDVRGVEQRLDALLKAVQQRPRPVAPATVQLGSDATPADAMGAALAHQREVLRGMGI